jgi:hypothetical protein
MKTIVLATAIALAAAAPALAKSPKPAHVHVHASQRALDANASLGAAGPFGVYINRGAIARDGDAAARSLGREEYFDEQYGG